MTIKQVIICGAFGKMGQVAKSAIQTCPSLNAIASLTRGDSLANAITYYKPDIVVDFTHPSAVKAHANICIDHQVHPVIGTSGLLSNEISELEKRCQSQQLGALIIPNFSIGAIIMMHMATMAAPFFDHVEITESHQSTKVDFPSATARETARSMLKTNPNLKTDSLNRGDTSTGIHIHSKRPPIEHAIQQVELNTPHEQLTIEARALSRESYAKGIILACKQVTELNGLQVGLSHCIFK